MKALFIYIGIFAFQICNWPCIRPKQANKTMALPTLAYFTKILFFPMYWLGQASAELFLCNLFNPEISKAQSGAAGMKTACPAAAGFLQALWGAAQSHSYHPSGTSSCSDMASLKSLARNFAKCTLTLDSSWEDTWLPMQIRLRDVHQHLPLYLHWLFKNSSLC